MADPFQSFVAWFADYGYPVLAAGVLLENAGLPVPGETALLAAGFLASPAGGGYFDIAIVIAVAAVSAVVGDNLGFWLGRRFARPRLAAGKRFLFLTPRALQAAEGYFQRYGTWTVFFARFIAGLRVVGAVAAGTAGMPWGRFLAANAAGAVAWSVAMGLLGYFFGHSWHLLHNWLSRGGLILLACVAVLAGLAYLMHRLRKMPAGQWKLARAQVIQGVLAALLEVACIAVLLALAAEERTDAAEAAVGAWVAARPPAAGGPAADVGSWAGSLPVTLAVTAGLVTLLWKRGRPRRDLAVAVWALAASEAVGLILVGLLHTRQIQPVRAQTWPFGFAGLVPLRAFAVYSAAAYLLTRDRPGRRVGAWLLAAVPILLAGFGVMWVREQTIAQVLLEYVAGAVVLFIGVAWREGLGTGLQALEAGPPPAPPQAVLTEPATEAGSAPPGVSL